MANPPMTDNDIAAVVSAAVAAERERCARVVEMLYFNPGNAILCGDTLDAAAAAIRQSVESK